jgi:hypothetical protein
MFAVTTLSAICPCPRAPGRTAARTATDTVRAALPDLRKRDIPGLPDDATQNTMGSLAFPVVADCANASRLVMIDVTELAGTVFSRRDPRPPRGRLPRDDRPDHPDQLLRPDAGPGPGKRGRAPALDHQPDMPPGSMPSSGGHRGEADRLGRRPGPQAIPARPGSPRLGTSGPPVLKWAHASSGRSVYMT